jgi:anti-anti-sigma factor
MSNVSLSADAELISSRSAPPSHAPAGAQLLAVGESAAFRAGHARVVGAAANLDARTPRAAYAVPGVKRMTDELENAVATFAVRVEPDRETVCVTPSGELDLATVAELREQVEELLAAGFEQLVIDLRGLSFMDASGLRLFLGLANDARRDGWRLSLIQGTHQVRRMFVLTATLNQLPFVLPARPPR